jgi:hypothetical protein
MPWGDDRILMVASDRISAFDVIMGEPIPGKGELLTQMALFWFDKLGPNGQNMCPIHLTGEAPKAWCSPMRCPGARPLHAGQAPETHSGGGRGAGLPGRQRLEGVPAEQRGLRCASCPRG